MSRRASRERPGPDGVVSGAVYVAAMTLVAGVSAWPIYGSRGYLVLALASVAAAVLLAVVSRAFGWGAPVTALATVPVVLALGLALVVPDLVWPPAQWPDALLQVLAGATTGWKDLLTVDPPVGSYRNLAMPAVVVFVVGPLSALRLSWRSGWSAAWAVPVAVAMVLFGVAFGPGIPSAPLAWGPATIPTPIEGVVAAAAFITSLAWLAARAHHERARALRRAARLSGVRVGARRSGPDLRRRVLGGALVLVTVATSAAALAPSAQERERTVLRSGAGPQVTAQERVSPLSTYRAAFGDTRIDDLLFQVDAVEGELPERLRVAVLSDYDGEVFRPADPGGDDAAARYRRVPAARSPQGSDRAVVQVRVGALGGIWVPMPGPLVSVVFSGPRASELANGFYYDARDGSAIETAGSGLAAGDVFRLSVASSPSPALATAAAPGVLPAVDAPPALRAWVQEHAVGSGGAELARLVELLRSRGYLSHSLGVDGPPVWAQRLEGYRFVPSAAGHSLARIDAMFESLRAQEAAGVTAETAVGDDEQFAVATVLIAQELGFPARVVMGVRTRAQDRGLSHCADGACRAGDLAVWVEVRSSTGDWIPVDVTPQWAQPPTTETEGLRDPRNATDVRPEPAEGIDRLPPEPQGAAEDQSAPPSSAAGAGWALVRAAGIGVLVLFLLIAPFATVVLVKAARRRSRRTVGGPRTRIEGGWDQYVDDFLDAGVPIAARTTRAEQAGTLPSPGAAELAAAADRATFAAEEPSEEQVRSFWAEVETARTSRLRAEGLWRAARAVVSWRSLGRSLGFVPWARVGPESAGERRADRRRAVRGADE